MMYGLPEAFQILWLNYFLFCSSELSNNARMIFFDDTYHTTFFHLVVNSVTGKVYIGAKNRLYQLTESLQLEASVITGPSEDNPNCPPPSIECKCFSSNCKNLGLEKSLMANINKYLVIDYQGERLIVCSNLFQGHCKRHLISNITLTDSPNVSMILVPNDELSSVVMFVGPGPPHPASTNALYIASTRSTLGLPEYKDMVPAISMRSLSDLNFVSDDILTPSRIDIELQQRDLFRVHYVYGFPSLGFSYFLSVQKISAITDSESYMTMISRICQSDKSLYSYTEIPLECSHNGMNYNILRSAYVTLPGSRLAKSLALSHIAPLTDVEHVLFAVFSQQNQHQYGSDKSALCIFLLRDIRRKFAKTIQDCFHGTGNTGPDHFVQPKPCFPTPFEIGDDYCGQHDINHPIKGNNPVLGQALFEWNSTNVTAVAVTTADESTIAFVGTENGFIKKVLIDSHREGREYESTLVERGVRINQQLAFDRLRKHLYVLTPKKVFKIPVSDCQHYATCDQCLAIKAFKCGWYTFEKSCSIRSVCPDIEFTNRWISGPQAVCPTIYSTPSYADNNRDLNVTETMTSLPELKTDEYYSCVFGSHGPTSQGSVIGSQLICPMTQNKPHKPSSDPVCLGSNIGLIHANAGQPWNRYLSYVSMYANCTTVLESLEIVFLDGNYSYDMSFLESIREVNGYVLIDGNHFDFLPLKNLRLIRGRVLYFPSGSTVGYSLYISTNLKPNSTSVGLKELHFKSLHEILDGNVLIENNNLLCHVETINWTDILGDASRVQLKPTPQGEYRRHCEECHPNCTFNGATHCWGPEPDKCQKITKGVCNSICEWGCFGPDPHQCCDEQCAGGCGHNRSGCWTCRHFVDHGECMNTCPGEMVYNITSYRNEPNPDVRYAYGAHCLKECPGHTLKENGACVARCSHGYMPDKDKKCKQCKNGICPKTCPGNGVVRRSVTNFSGCSIIDGSLLILMKTFSGPNAISNVSALNVFESVEEITGYLLVQGNHEHFNTLSFLRNLRVVRGRTLLSGFAVIISCTSLVELGLTSLKEISSGNVRIRFNQRLERLGLTSLEWIGDGTIDIQNNSNLCHVDSINWTHISANQTRRIVVENNANKTDYCEPNGSVCSSQCTSDGCWGPTNEDCRYCTGYRFGRACVESCQFQKGLYAEEVNGAKLCQRCHEECQDSCVGKEPNDCEECRNVRDGRYCRAICPVFKYANASGICQPCHKNCKDGCTGPGNHLGFNGCSACHIAMELKEGTLGCLQDDSRCPDGFYRFQRRFGAFTQNGTQKLLVDLCQMNVITSITTAVSDVTYTDSYWFVMSLSLAAVLSIFLVLMTIMCLNFYICRRRISTDGADSVQASRFASLDQPTSDEYEIMPYAYTDAYDNIEDVIETDLDAPTQFSMRDDPLPTPGYDSLLPRPSTPTVYCAIDNYEQPMESNDIEIIPCHTSESDMDPSVAVEHSVNVNARESSYLQLISGDPEPMNSCEISQGHESESEFCSDSDTSAERGKKFNAKHSAYIELIGDTAREETSPTCSTVSVARNEINRLSTTSNNSENEIPSSYLKINEDVTDDDSSEEIPSSYLKISEDISKDDN